MLDELVTPAVQVLQVDRIAPSRSTSTSLIMAPRVVKSFGGVGTHYPYSHRVVDWVVDHGSPATFPDVSRAIATSPATPRRMPASAARCASRINPGGGTIGAIYVDSLMKADCFRPDDLAPSAPSPTWPRSRKARPSAAAEPKGRSLSLHAASLSGVP